MQSYRHTQTKNGEKILNWIFIAIGLTMKWLGGEKEKNMSKFTYVTNKYAFEMVRNRHYSGIHHRYKHCWLLSMSIGRSAHIRYQEVELQQDKTWKNG